MDLALTLWKIREIPGARALRDAIRGTARSDALMSPRLQMRIAVVALGLGLRVEVEPMMPGASAPADLLVADAAVSCPVEVLAVMRDAATIQADEWLNTIMGALREITQRYCVELKGSVPAPLDEAQSRELLQSVERHAAGTALGLELPAVRVGDVSIAASPPSDVAGKMSFDLPRIAYDRRIANKLAAKARQAHRTHARWLIADWMDNLWHLTAWGTRPLAEKAHDLAGLVRRLLGAELHIEGVVFTDGAVLMRPDVPDETAELSHDAVAMRRRIDRWHTREAVVIPLRAHTAPAADMWRRVLDAERGWALRELEELGLEAPLELVAA
ncbi:MAG: hypothetical protein ACRDK7_06605 [Solirubrobacteraceae bacterium]